MQFYFTPLSKEIEINQIVSLHYFAYTKQFTFQGESHDFWEIVFCDSGEALITDNEQTFIMPQGCVFIHAPNHFHNVRPNGKYTNVAIFSFTGELGDLISCTGRVISIGMSEKSYIKNILSEGKKGIMGALDIVEQQQIALNPGAPLGNLQMIKNCLELLVISIMRRNIVPSESERAEKNLNYKEYITARIIDILTENIGNNLRLEEIASKLGYSPTYLKKIFKEQSGYPIIQYFIKLKIERAKQLMSESVYSVSQISEMLGFDSLQYFSRRFKKLTNMSPSQYLKSVRIDELL